MENVQTILEVCILPLLGILVKFISSFLDAKREQAKAATDSIVAQKYIDMAFNTVDRCVITTNQTYVNALKNTGDFTEEAQKEAFQKTLDAVLVILSDDAKEYISTMTGDLDAYLRSLIESQVNANKKGEQ